MFVFRHTDVREFFYDGPRTEWEGYYRSRSPRRDDDDFFAEDEREEYED